LFHFQNEDIIIPKNKKAYGYNYAPLDSIIEIIKPYLEKHKIGYNHIVDEDDNGKVTVTTYIFNYHNEDDYIKSETTIDDSVKLSGMNKFMVIGSAITYYRRYHLVVMLGLTTDEDSDAGGAVKSENKKTATTSKQTSGRSIQSAKSESEVDYVAIFENLVAKNKTIDQLNKMFSTYKKNMSNETIKQVTEIIKKSKDENK